MGKATVTQPPSNPPPYNKPSVVTTTRVGNASQANSLLSLKREKESQIELPSKQIKQDAKNSQTWTHEEILAILHWLSNKDNLTAFRSNALAQYKVMEQKLDIGKTAGQIQRQLEFLGEKYKLIRIRSSMEKPASPEKQKEANCKSFQYFALMDDIFGDDNNKRSKSQQAPTRSQTLAMGPGPGTQQSGKKSESSQTYFYLPKPIRPSQIKNNNTNLNSTTNGVPPVNKPKHSATVSAFPSSTTTFNRPPPTRGETLPTTNFKRLMPSNGQGSHERFDRTYPVLGSHHHHQGESYSPTHDDGELSPLQSQVLRKKLHLLETQERYLEEQRQDMVIERNQNQAQLDMISKNLLSLNQQIEKQSQILMDLVSQLRDQKK